jgi:uncharacterized membrane protein (DUF2068 family)
VPARGLTASARRSGEDEPMTQQQSSSGPAVEPGKDRLVPLIAAERAFRALVLSVIGLVLLTHPHADWAHEISNFVQKLGLDPKGNWIQRILKDAARVDSRKSTLYGIVALAYAALEGAEAYGLWRRRRWGEWLTVLATSLLLIPEVWELTKSTTALKVGALLVNLAVVLYLLVRLGVVASPRKGPRTRRAD